MCDALCAFAFACRCGEGGRELLSGSCAGATPTLYQRQRKAHAAQHNKPNSSILLFMTAAINKYTSTRASGFLSLLRNEFTHQVGTVAQGDLGPVPFLANKRPLSRRQSAGAPAAKARSAALEKVCHVGQATPLGGMDCLLCSGGRVDHTSWTNKFAYGRFCCAVCTTTTYSALALRGHSARVVPNKGR